MVRANVQRALVEEHARLAQEEVRKNTLMSGMIVLHVMEVAIAGFVVAREGVGIVMAEDIDIIVK